MVEHIHELGVMTYNIIRKVYIFPLTEIGHHLFERTVYLQRKIRGSVERKVLLVSPGSTILPGGQSH